VLLVGEGMNKSAVRLGMYTPMRKYEMRTSRITATGGGKASNTSPVVAHVIGLPRYSVLYAAG